MNLEKLRALPTPIKLVIACAICLAVAAVIIGVIQWLTA